MNTIFFSRSISGYCVLYRVQYSSTVRVVRVVYPYPHPVPGNFSDTTYYCNTYGTEIPQLS